MSCCKTYRMTSEGKEHRKKAVQSQTEAIPRCSLPPQQSKEASKRATISRSARKQERAFCENPWSFSKSVCCPKTAANPSFTMETGLNHFQSSFEASGPQYSSLPAWVEEVMPHPEITSNFDMSLVTLPNMSAPGPDKISYLHLKSCPVRIIFSQCYTSKSF